MTNLPVDFMYLLSELREPSFKLGEVAYSRYYISEFVEWVDSTSVSDEAKARFREMFKGDEYMKASPFDVEMSVETLLRRAHIEAGNDA